MPNPRLNFRVTENSFDEHNFLFQLDIFCLVNLSVKDDKISTRKN